MCKRGDCGTVNDRVKGKRYTGWSICISGARTSCKQTNAPRRGEIQYLHVEFLQFSITPRAIFAEGIIRQWCGDVDIAGKFAVLSRACARVFNRKDPTDAVYLLMRRQQFLLRLQRTRTNWLIANWTGDIADVVVSQSTSSLS